MAVDWRPRNGLETLDLSGRRDVELLQEVKARAQGDDHRNEVDVRVAHDDDGAEDTEQLANQASEDLRDCYVSDVNILGEPVKDSAQGSGIEKRHWGPEDAL